MENEQKSSPTEKVLKLGDIIAQRVELNDPKQMEAVFRIDQDPKVNRHLISDAENGTEKLSPEERKQKLVEWVRDEPVYGIYEISDTGEKEIKSLVYFYPNEDPDYPQDYELSVFVPNGVSIEVVGKGLEKSIDAFKLEENRPEMSLVFFSLQDQSQSMANDADLVDDESFLIEVDDEHKILFTAGFTQQDDIENGDVGVFSYQPNT